jgi:hypothetical protein
MDIKRKIAKRNRQNKNFNSHSDTRHGISVAVVLIVVRSIKCTL